MSERHRFIPQSVSKDFIAAGVAASAILSGVQAPSHDVFSQISPAPIVSTVDLFNSSQVVFDANTNFAHCHSCPPRMVARQRPRLLRGEVETNGELFNKDMEEIAGLQTIFNEALGIESDGREEIRSYNPVLARWKFEKLKTDEEKERFKKYELKQMETNLRERYHAAQSVVNYIIDNEGNVYNELFPDEPFVKVLERGVVYRRNQGSPEIEREEAELRGFIKNMKKLTDPTTPIDAKMICISPPGIVVDTTYKDNFVDFLEVKEDPATGARTIQLTRFKSSMGYKDYVDIIDQEKPGFFKDKTGPIDAIILEEGIYTEDSRTPREILKELFWGADDAMDEEDFRYYIYGPTTDFSINYIGELLASEFDPLRVAKAYNAILVAGDEGNLNWRNQESSEGRVSVYDFTNIAAYAQILGERRVTVVAAGCGPSAGFSFGKDASDFLSNSVAKFGVDNQYTGENAKNDPSLCRCGGKEAHFHCPGTAEEECGKEIIVGKGITKCTCGAGATCK